MVEGTIGVNEGTTKKLRTQELTVGLNIVEQEVITLAKDDGTLITDLATQTTLAAINTKIPASPATEGGNLASIKSDLDTIVTQTAHDNGDGRIYKQKNGSCNANGDNAVIAAVGGKVLKIYDYSLQAQGTVIVTPSSDVGGSAAAIGQPWDFQVREGKNKHSVPAGAPYDFVTAQGKAFNLFLSAGVVVGYEIIYTDSDAS